MSGHRPVLVLIAALLLSPSPAMAGSADEPFAVGLRQFTMAAAADGPAVPVSVWYPAAGPSAASGDATPDAPPATGGPFPLVLVIHGLGGTGVMMEPVARAFAAHGLVAAAADFDSLAVERQAALDDRRMIWLLHERPANAARVISFIDALAAPGGRLAGLADTSRIGVWGHSTGGTTAFQAAGARIDLKALDEWCDTHRTNGDADETCQFEGHEQALASHFGAADPYAAPLAPLIDPRVAAIVTVSPGGELHAFGQQGIAAVRVPALVMFADDDTDVSPQFNALWAYDGIASPDKAMAAFGQGGHALFIDPASASFQQATDLAADFFLAMLKGDPSGKARLAADAVTLTGASYTSTLRR